MVNPTVAIAIPASPQISIAITVAIAEAKIFTKLLPIRITPINWSVRCSKPWARLAPLWPVLAICLRRYRLRDIIPVSELEKNPESRISATRSMNSAVSDVSGSFKRGVLMLLTSSENRVLASVVSREYREFPGLAAALEDQLQHKLAAVECQHQKCAAGQGPSASGNPAPAFGVPAYQERHENQQGQDGEQGLVSEILGKKVFYKEGTGHDCQNQHHDAGPDHFKQ